MNNSDAIHKAKFFIVEKSKSLIDDLVMAVFSGTMTFDEALNAFGVFAKGLEKMLENTIFANVQNKKLLEELKLKANSNARDMFKKQLESLGEHQGQGFARGPPRRYGGYGHRRYGRYRPQSRYWPQYRYGTIPAWYRPAVDYRDNYWIPPYEIPVEPNYFPGYNIVERTPPYNDYYWPVR